MPLSTVLPALLFSHGKLTIFGPYWAIIPGAASVALAAALGGLLGSWICGLFSLAFLLLFLGRSLAQAAYPYSFYTVLFLMVAGIAAWRSRAPGLWKDLFLGIAVGVSLTFRSTLALFPPVLVLGEAVLFRRTRGRGFWYGALVLCVVPYLFLVPWVHMNWAVHERFAPFELGSGSVNVIAAARGLVMGIDGDVTILLEDDSSAVERSVMGWATREVLRHPFRYISSCLVRLGHIVSLQPFLLLLALWALWVYRERVINFTKRDPIGRLKWVADRHGIDVDSSELGKEYRAKVADEWKERIGRLRDVVRERRSSLKGKRGRDKNVSSNAFATRTPRLPRSRVESKCWKKWRRLKFHPHLDASISALPSKQQAIKMSFL